MTISLVDSSINADSITYEADGSVVSGNTYSFASAGTYTVCQYAYNNCGLDTLCKQITVIEVGINETNLLYKLYPNPASGTITVELPTGGYRLELFSALGELLQTIDFHNRTTFETGNLPQGIYLYRITSADNKVDIGKLIVE